MENKIGILKNLGFSDEFLKIISEDLKTGESTSPSNMIDFEYVNTNTSDNFYPIIEITEKPINSDFIYNER